MSTTRSANTTTTTNTATAEGDVCSSNEEEEEEEDADNDDDDNLEHLNIIVMTDAGKPIFARSGSEEEVSRVCGMLQAIRTYSTTPMTTTKEHGDQGGSLNLGDIQCLRSGSMCLVFMIVEAITLVAISTTTKTANKSSRAAHDECGSYRSSGSRPEPTEAFLRLQLEYVYANMILSLTQSVQTMLKDYPGLDVRSLLGSSTELAMRDVIAESEISGEPASFVLGGSPSCFPIDPTVREQVSQILRDVGESTPNTVFALVFSSNQLITLVQPFFQPYQLRASDLHLFLHFVGRQSQVFSDELWLPVCLPRFNSSGMLYCYTNCLDETTKTILALVSQDGSTDQIMSFRQAASEIRRRLGLEDTPESVLEIGIDETVEQSSAAASGGDVLGSDVKWKRNHFHRPDPSCASPEQSSPVSLLDANNSDEDYVDVTTEGDEDDMIPYVGIGATGDTKSSHSRVCPFLNEVRAASMSSKAKKFVKRCLELAGAVHFMFRLDVPIVRKDPRGAKCNQEGGYLAQCISSPVGFPFVSAPAKRHLWSTYQKLSLRLRLRSATIEATLDAFDMIQREHEAKHFHFPGIGKDCPAMELVESSPTFQDGISFVVDGYDTFLALSGKNNGKDFQL